jgi:hypothetical protein
LGRDDKVEGLVVSIVCLRDNSGANAETLKKCTAERSKQGGVAAVLTADGHVYVDERGAGTTAKLLGQFAGNEVIIEGQTSTEPADIELPGYQVHKFRVAAVRSKNVTPGPKGDVRKRQGPVAK